MLFLSLLSPRISDPEITSEELNKSSLGLRDKFYEVKWISVTKQEKNLI